MSTQSSKVRSVGGNSIGCSGSGESKGKGTLHEFVSSEPRQTTLNSTYKKDLLVDVKRRIGHFIYSAALPFNVVNDPYWLPMVEGIAEYGRGFKPPSMHELRTWILKAEDIAKLEIFSNTIEHAKMVVKFLYGHGTILSLMRKYTNDKEILRPAVTRFATSFLTLQSMYKVKRRLEQMFASEDWVSSPLSQTTRGRMLSSDDRLKADIQLDLYDKAEGEFGTPIAKRTRMLRTPVDEINSDEWITEKEGPVLPVTTKWLEDDELFESDPILSVPSATFESLFDSDKRVEDVEYIVEVPPTNSKKSGSKDKQARLSLVDVEDNHLDAENYGVIPTFDSGNFPTIDTIDDDSDIELDDTDYF
ncbi:hypothetical protein ZIOFF_003952 [Zingiber officinale]|uniref:Uncharacterized protein n=1 Tax=Zingiber officinale TaxID=94328 RepID=A0A8J5HZB2_ZINOF|nr:hypothetical protein ZIOFF_003952 [Zingiber officinale]